LKVRFEIVMQQELFALSSATPLSSNSLVNVASVPHRSPFRYPGGKTWFVPAFRRWMQSMQSAPQVLVESFAGGATVGLTAVCEGWVDHAVLVELDPEVASVWQVICAGDAPQLAEKILAFELSVDTVTGQLARETNTTLDLTVEFWHLALASSSQEKPGKGLPRAGIPKRYRKDCRRCIWFEIDLPYCVTTHLNLRKSTSVTRIACSS
jgi:hypothetical protein